MTERPKKDESITIRLPADVKKKIQAEADRKKVSVSRVILDSIDGDK
jgi:predicted transcriptional regulator